MAKVTDTSNILIFVEFEMSGEYNQGALSAVLSGIGKGLPIEFILDRLVRDELPDPRDYFELRVAAEFIRGLAGECALGTGSECLDLSLTGEMSVGSPSPEDPDFRDTYMGYNLTGVQTVDAYNKVCRLFNLFGPISITKERYVPAFQSEHLSQNVEN